MGVLPPGDTFFWNSPKQILCNFPLARTNLEVILGFGQNWHLRLDLNQCQYAQYSNQYTPSMRDCSEKSILTKQINNSIYLSANRTFFPLISLSDIVCINKLTLKLRIICHCDVKHIIKLTPILRIICHCDVNWLWYWELSVIVTSNTLLNWLW
jgi:hypothetical protein